LTSGQRGGLLRLVVHFGRGADPALR
jgi:hypothetical protein